VEAKTMQKDAREGNVIAVKEQLSTKMQVEVHQVTKVQAMVKAQQRAMEMERHELEVRVKKRHTILGKATLLKKGIKILNHNDSCGHKRNKIMTNMLNEWKTRGYC